MRQSERSRQRSAHTATATTSLPRLQIGTRVSPAAVYPTAGQGITSVEQSTHDEDVISTAAEAEAARRTYDRSSGVSSTLQVS